MSFISGLPRDTWGKEVAQYLPLEDRSHLSRTCKKMASFDLVLKYPDAQERIATIRTQCTQRMQLYIRAYPNDPFLLLPLITVINDLSSEKKTQYLPALQRYQSVFNEWWLDNGHALRRVAPESAFSHPQALEAVEIFGPMFTRAISNDHLLLAEAIGCAFHAAICRFDIAIDLLNTKALSETVLNKYLKKQDTVNAERLLTILFNISLRDMYLQDYTRVLSIHYLKQNNTIKAQELAIKADKHVQDHGCWNSLVAYYIEKGHLTEASKIIKSGVFHPYKLDGIATDLVRAYANNGDPQAAETCRNTLMKEGDMYYRLASGFVLCAYINKQDLPNAERIFSGISKDRHSYQEFHLALEAARAGRWTPMPFHIPPTRFNSNVI